MDIYKLVQVTNSVPFYKLKKGDKFSMLTHINMKKEYYIKVDDKYRAIGLGRFRWHMTDDKEMVVPYDG